MCVCSARVLLAAAAKGPAPEKQGPQLPVHGTAFAAFCKLPRDDRGAAGTVHLIDNAVHDYAGARIKPGVAADLDGLNIHIYSFFRLDNGTRIYVHPEHPGSEFNSELGQATLWVPS